MSSDTRRSDAQVIASNDVVEPGFSLDPSHYSRTVERVLRHLKQRADGSSRLEDWPGFRKVYLPTRFTRVYVPSDDHGAPMLGTSTMLALRLPQNSRIRLKDPSEASPLWIQEGDILISRSGSVGTAVLCGATYVGFVASDDCLRLRFAEEERGFISTYLQSQLGQTLLTRARHGKVIRHLKEKDVATCLVPHVADEVRSEINRMALRAAALVDEARTLLADVELALTAALSLPHAPASHPEALGASRLAFLQTNATSDTRLDPHYFVPAIGDLRRRVSDLARVRLGNVARVWMPTRFARPPADEGHGVPFYSSGDLMRARRIPGSHVSMRAARHLSKCTVASRQILVCRSGAFGGIMGRATFVSPMMDGWTASEHLLRCAVTSGDYSPEYIFAVLGSMTVGYPLITALRHGKDVPELDPDDLAALPVPHADDGTRARISALVTSAFGKVDEANALQDDAHDALLSSLGWAPASAATIVSQSGTGADGDSDASSDDADDPDDFGEMAA